jgi:hypothetical protein
LSRRVTYVGGNSVEILAGREGQIGDRHHGLSGLDDEPTRNGAVIITVVLQAAVLPFAVVQIIHFQFHRALRVRPELEYGPSVLRQHERPTFFFVDGDDRGQDHVSVLFCVRRPE